MMDNEQMSQLLQQMTELNSRVESLQEQNRELRGLVNSSINTVPILVREELQPFLTQFNEALKNPDSSKTAEAIRELTAVLKELKGRLTNSELMHADMTAQVTSAVDEIRALGQGSAKQGDDASAEDEI